MWLLSKDFSKITHLRNCSGIDKTAHLWYNPHNEKAAVSGGDLVRVKIVKVNTPEDFGNYEALLSKISPERRERISQMKFPRKKTISLVTELLVRSEISKALGIDRGAIEFSYNEYGKPFLPGGGFFFSVSHSGEYIAFAGDTKHPVGVDIQTVGKADFRVAERFFTKEEYSAICSSSAPEREFYKIWSLKEAYVKMLGTGMATPFTSFSVLSDDVKSMSFFKDCGDYVLAVCGKDIDIPQNTAYHPSAE